MKTRVFEFLSIVVVAFVVVSVLRSTLSSADIGEREKAALELVRGIRDLETAVAAEGRFDSNGNGIGEFVLLPLLLPSTDGDAKPATPPLLDVPVIPWSGDVVELADTGYLFTVYLPAADGSGTRSPEDPRPDPTLAERAWCLYAWPVRFGITGRRVFFTNGSGRIYQTENLGEAYEGVHAAPPWESAFRDPSEGMTGRIVSTGRHGSDGRIWELLEEAPGVESP